MVIEVEEIEVEYPPGQYHIFTDGSCRKNPGAGGWACVIRNIDNGDESEFAGAEKETTNNRMEMTGVIKALEKIPAGSKVTLWSDSQYTTRGISEWMRKWKKNGWKKKGWDSGTMEEVLNVDLWKRIDELVARHELKVEWVRGHNGHPENERCDVLAGEAASVYYS
jgi:ribonuclease HI